MNSKNKFHTNEQYQNPDINNVFKLKRKIDKVILKIYRGDHDAFKIKQLSNLYSNYNEKNKIHKLSQTQYKKRSSFYYPETCKYHNNQDDKYYNNQSWQQSKLRDELFNFSPKEKIPEKKCLDFEHFLNNELELDKYYYLSKPNRNNIDKFLKQTYKY